MVGDSSGEDGRRFTRPRTRGLTVPEKPANPQTLDLGAVCYTYPGVLGPYGFVGMEFTPRVRIQLECALACWAYGREWLYDWEPEDLGQRWRWGFTSSEIKWEEKTL